MATDILGRTNFIKGEQEQIISIAQYYIAALNKTGMLTGLCHFPKIYIAFSSF